MRPLFLDVDPGGDDALAIALALRTPGARVVGVAATAGNDLLAVTATHTAQILDYLGAPTIPLALGSTRRDAFIQGEGEETALRRIAAHWPAPSHVAQRPTVDLLLDAIQQHPDNLTIVALAPLTNIADAVRQAPDALRRIHELVILGGAFETTEWTRPTGAELNIYMDPEAAAVVFAADIPRITVLSLDVTNQIGLTAELVQALAAVATPEAALARQCYDAWCAAMGGTIFPLWDPVTVAVALDPTLARTEPCAIEVLTTAQEFGRTRVVPGTTINRVVAIDKATFLHRFMRALGAP